MAKGAPGVKRGARADVAKRFAELEGLYEKARRGRRIETPSRPSTVAEATGDPLAQEDAALSEAVWELSGVARPAVHLRRLRHQLFGDTTDAAIALIEHFKRGRSITDTLAAAEAVVLMAQRRAFIGASSPVSFKEATDRARKAWSKRRLREPFVGWTGRWLFVRPKVGLRLRLPEDLSQFLPAEGRWVKDCLFWRRRVDQGDVTLERRREDSPTNVDRRVLNDGSLPGNTPEQTR